MTTKIRNKSLANLAYDQLKDLILSGKLKSGESISEIALAEQFGISRTPIREGIRKLAEYGLVKLVPNNNAVIYTISKKEAKDIAIVRLGLEQLAVDNIKPDSLSKHMENLSRLSSDCHYYLSIGDRSSVFEMDSCFHQEIIKCSENLPLIKLYQKLDGQIQLLRIDQNLSSLKLLEHLNHHSEIIQLLKLDDKEACKKLLEKHIYHNVY